MDRLIDCRAGGLRCWLRDVADGIDSAETRQPLPLVCCQAACSTRCIPPNEGEVLNRRMALSCTVGIESHNGNERLVTIQSGELAWPHFVTSY